MCRFGTFSPIRSHIIRCAVIINPQCSLVFTSPCLVALLKNLHVFLSLITEIGGLSGERCESPLNDSQELVTLGLKELNRLVNYKEDFSRSEVAHKVSS